MKIFHAQHRPRSLHASFGLSLFDVPAMALTLAVSCTFLSAGCADRHPTAKNPEAAPPPVTTAPVLAPPNGLSSAPAESETGNTREHPTPTGRVADDAPEALGSSATPSDRGPEEGPARPVGADTGTPPAVPPDPTTLNQPPPGATDEEDVSAALRREIAEVERRRAQQPRGW